jgi:hypothetical protein
VYFSAGNTTDKVVFGANGKVILHNVQQLQLMNRALAGKYELGTNIDASATSGWNYNDITKSYEGFEPIGYVSETAFTGSFNGLGRTISGLTICRPEVPIGLLGYAVGADIHNVGLVGGSMKGQNYVGSLLGFGDNGSRYEQLCNVHRRRRQGRRRSRRIFGRWNHHQQLCDRRGQGQC